MAAKLDSDTTLDDHEDEIIHTRAAMEADPDAADLVPLTDSWMPRVDAARSADRDARQAAGRATAHRRVANARLDASCRAFGDELWLSVAKDPRSARWKRFFAGVVATIWAFIRQPLADQAARVRAWLDVTGDAVLDRHRPELDRWSGAAQAALTMTSATATVRGNARVVREQLAEDLTRSRDALEAVLVERGQERGLPREWPSVFFRVRSSSSASSRTENDGGDPGTA